MNIETIIAGAAAGALKTLYGFEPQPGAVQIQNTRKEFEGDFTLAIFPFLRFSKQTPEATGTGIGNYILENVAQAGSFNVVGGFLNITMHANYWLEVLTSAYAAANYGLTPANSSSPLAMVEYSSPNTNKPLHLGHIRNNLLGYSIAEILKANGNRVIKTNLVNDRGIHICKSMHAWLAWGNGETPASAGLKGDHLVGKYYVEFDRHYKTETAALVRQGLTQEEAESRAPSILAARELLVKWEARDPQTINLWQKMNGWVYEGFDVTYRNLGVDFDKIYYESETYLTGRHEILRGVSEGVFEQQPDGSVWANLTSEGLDRKILLRSDGTSVYITQDVGTAKVRFADYPIDRMIYVVGNEQNYHFKVLSAVLDKLGYKWGKELCHFSYGMVELPSGKMKSREGTVVDADDLIHEMTGVARQMSAELSKLNTLPPEEAEETFRIIALGALKYFILKVDPRKNMMFNPEESIDFNGNTGPFIQYTYARIRSVLRKAEEQGIHTTPQLNTPQLQTKEKELIKRIAQFPAAVHEAGNNLSPAVIANYSFELVKEYNQFYHDHSILSEPNPQTRNLRLTLSETVARVVKSAMNLLGIEVPERM